AANTIVRWNGTIWQPLGSGLEASSNAPFVRGLALYQGKLIAGGYFDSAGGVPVDDVAQWDGTTWQPLGTDPHGIPFAFTIDNGKLIAGGDFSIGRTTYGVMQWTGTSWQPLGTGGW